VERWGQKGWGLFSFHLFIPFYFLLLKSFFVLLFKRVADPDPGSGGFLTPGSGIRDGLKVSGFRDEQPGSYFLELRKKYLNSLMRIRDGKIRIRDGKMSDPG
jgi:hypothetical protein